MVFFPLAFLSGLENDLKMKSVAIILILTLAGCATIHQTRQPSIHHVVICWLKEAGNVSQRQQIVETARSFRSIPGVLEVRSGEVLPSDRQIVDDSFDVAIIVSLADQKSLEAYLAHPTHQKAKDKILLPLVRKIVVYDFTE